MHSVGSPSDSFNLNEFICISILRSTNTFTPILDNVIFAVWIVGNVKFANMYQSIMIVGAFNMGGKYLSEFAVGLVKGVEYLRRGIEVYSFIVSIKDIDIHLPGADRASGSTTLTTTGIVVAK